MGIVAAGSDVFLFGDTKSDTMVGKKSIKQNFKDMKYEVHAEPTHIEETPDKITMQVTATGNFKGSPLNFEYYMKLRSGVIQDLKIDLMQ